MHINQAVKKEFKCNGQAVNEFEKLEEGVYRLCVPFENIYTTVFALIEDNRCIIFDGATTEDDVENYIVPAIKSLGVTPGYIICSHVHIDHYGGIPYLLKRYHNAVMGLYRKDLKFDNETSYLNDGDVLLGRFKILNLKGHTDDCIAILDLKSNILISGDCLQQIRIGNYPVTCTDKNEYFKTLKRAGELGIEKIIFSHDYEPCGYLVEGKENIEKCLEICKKAAEEI